MYKPCGYVPLAVNLACAVRMQAALSASNFGVMTAGGSRYGQRDAVAELRLTMARVRRIFYSTYITFIIKVYSKGATT